MDLKPVFGGIKMNKKIIGITEDETLICIDRKYDENIKNINIYTYRLNL